MKKTYFMLIFGIIICVLIAGNLPINAEEVDIHGFISQGYLMSDQNNYLAETDDGTFQFNEMGINFTTFVKSDLKMGCQFFSKDLGPIGNDEIIVNWAFAEYSFRNWLGLRTGLIKAPFGFQNDIRDFDSLRTSIFLPSSVYNEWLRDSFNTIKGIDLFGSLPMGAVGLLEYQLITGDTQFPLDSGTVRFIKEVTGSVDTINKIEVDRVYLTRLIWTTPVDGLRIAHTYLNSGSSFEGTRTVPVEVSMDSVEFFVFSAEYLYENFKIVAENMWFMSDTEVYIVGMPPIKSENDTKDSFYISLGYRFTDWFEAACYYSKYIDDTDKKEDSNELKDQCLSFRFDINPNWIVKLETHLMNGEFGVEPDDDGHIYSEWMLFAAKLSYSF